MKHKLIRIVALVLAVSCIMAVPAAAAEHSDSVSAYVPPRYINLSTIYASIDINDSGKATCYGWAETYSDYDHIYMTLGLQRYKNSSWSTVKSWSTSGYGDVTLQKSYYITSGYYYRTAVTLTVYNSDGDYVETQTVYSQNYYY